MDKNTPLSSLPSSGNEMESKGKDLTKNKPQADPNEPSVQLVKNIENYSKALNVQPSKTVLQFVEYIKN